MDEFTWVESTERRMNFKELHHLLDGWVEGEEEGRASKGASETWSLRVGGRREWGIMEGQRRKSEKGNPVLPRGC